uniref:T9SS type A sorting domain-containing protein n=1 Tax=candidate division WOR-3 bacterium TaxID=2052148 RepID=A0A7C3YT21_UNCW3
MINKIMKSDCLSRCPLPMGMNWGKISKFLIPFLFLSLTGFAQQTYNLEIIWQKGVVDSLFYVYGFDLGAGDFNGDGFSDIVIHGDSGPYPYTSKAYLFFGGNPFDTIPDIVFVGDSTLYGWHFTRARGIGDINGDGFDDLAINSRCEPDQICRIYIFLGGNPMDTIVDFKIPQFAPRGDFGRVIESGDVNGDGYSDLILGDYWAWNGWGGVGIYFGGPNFDTIPDVILKGGHENELECFGFSASGSGDVNNDGFSDIIIGAPWFGPGRIYIYFGGNPMDTIYDVAMSGEPGTLLGWDGVDFLKNEANSKDYAVAGTALWGGYSPGKIYVLFGGEEMDSVPDLWMIGRTDSSSLGYSISNAGFTARPEASDLIAGAPQEGSAFPGAAYLWLGGSLLDTVPDAWIKGTVRHLSLGAVVASAGDVDGDGRDEIMVSNYTNFAGISKVWVCKYTGVGIEEDQRQYIRRFALKIAPNPAKSQITIQFPLATESKVSLLIYDITGKLVKTIKKEENRLKPGDYELRWDLRDNNQKRVSNGIYFLEVRVDDETREIRKIGVIK